jgi:hypothetical protein
MSAHCGACQRFRCCPAPTPVYADLGHQYFGGAPTDARNGVEQRHRLLKTAHPLRDLRTHLRDKLVQAVDVRWLWTP